MVDVVVNIIGTDKFRKAKKRKSLLGIIITMILRKCGGKLRGTEGRGASSK